MNMRKEARLCSDLHYGSCFLFLGKINAHEFLGILRYTLDSLSRKSPMLDVQGKEKKENLRTLLFFGEVRFSRVSQLTCAVPM